MQTRPEITQGSIDAALQEGYGLALQGLEFWPSGEASYGFIASLKDGDSLFLKILDPTLATHGMAIAHLDEVLPLSLALSEAGLPVSRPMESREGSLQADLPPADHSQALMLRPADGPGSCSRSWTWTAS